MTCGLLTFALDMPSCSALCVLCSSLQLEMINWAYWLSSPIINFTDSKLSRLTKDDLVRIDIRGSNDFQLSSTANQRLESRFLTADSYYFW